MSRIASSLARVVGVVGLLGAPAWAEAPVVVTDILPVHGLVSQVMKGVGAPEVLLKTGASPHGYAMRPSEAVALSRADVVVWIGDELTPWLAGPLETLAGDARSVVLMEVAGTELHDFRDGDDEGGEDDHEHEEHADEEHADEEHADEEHAHEGHAHDVDPHAWLDPENATVWLDAIAVVLGEADPANAEVYLANAREGQDAIAQASEEIRAQLSEVGAFAIYHDSFQYLEKRFGLEASFVIQPDDAHQPGPARIGELRKLQSETRASCVFVEPFANIKLIDTVFEGTPVEVIEIDQLGAHIAPGEAFFPMLLRDIAQKFGACR